MWQRARVSEIVPDSGAREWARPHQTAVRESERDRTMQRYAKLSETAPDSGTRVSETALCSEIASYNGEVRVIVGSALQSTRRWRHSARSRHSRSADRVLSGTLYRKSRHCERNRDTDWMPFHAQDGDWKNGYYPGAGWIVRCLLSRQGMSSAWSELIKRHGSVLRRVHLSSKTRDVSLYARREIETSSDYFILLYYDNRWTDRALIRLNR